MKELAEEEKEAIRKCELTLHLVKELTGHDAPKFLTMLGLMFLDGHRQCKYPIDKFSENLKTIDEHYKKHP